MPQRPPSAQLLRFSAVLVLLLGIGCGALELAAVSQQTGDILVPTTAPASSPSEIRAAYGWALLPLFLGIGLSAMLEGLARLIQRQPARQPDVVTAVNQLATVIAELRAAIPETDLEPQTPVVATQVEPTDRKYFERMVALLEEIKELSMLDESQRHIRSQQAMTRRKTSKLQEADRLIQQRQWPQADALLHLLESLYPKDEEVMARRSALREQRDAAAAVDLRELGQRVTDLMALGQFDEAMARARQFTEMFPDNAEGQAILKRVSHEAGVFRAHTAGHMYDEIKSSVERRQWRRALEVAQRLLEKFPDHSKAMKIRPQLPTIQANAEIEERQEQEDRIQELIKSKRFGEAIELAEELLERFPSSPQAATLEEMLPKLRTLAGGEAGNFDAMIQ